MAKFHQDVSEIDGWLKRWGLVGPANVLSGLAKPSGFTPEGFDNTAQGRAAHPGKQAPHRRPYCEAVAQERVPLCNRSAVGRGVERFLPPVALREPGLCCVTAPR